MNTTIKSIFANCQILLTAILVATLIVGPGTAWAIDANTLPSGGQIIAGSGNIAQSGANMTVTQISDKLVANWDSFNIGQSAAVTFNQPSAQSAVINRISDQNPTQILGQLNANGQVFLLNPSGIIFGQTAQVDVGGLIASSLNMTDENFLNGNYRFTGDVFSGDITNFGNIAVAEGGVVALLGSQVNNEGSISTLQGSTALIAGEDVTLDFVGDGLINYSVEQGAVDALAANSGLIKADGGLVVMTAMAADALTSSVVNNTGVVEAQTLENREGRILLLSDMAHGETITGGTLDASAPNGGDGGFIETSAATVNMTNDLIVSASSASGSGGEWLIDPYNYTIDATAANNIVSTLNGGTDVTVDTASSVTNHGSSGNVNEIGDITVASEIAFSGTGTPTLTLNAANSIIVDAPIVNASESGGTLNVTLDADNDSGTGDGAGVVMLNADISTGGGNLSFGTGRTVNLGGVDTLVGGDVYVAGSGARALYTSGGNIDVRGEMIIANSSGLTMNTNGGDVRFYGLLNSGNSYSYTANGSLYWSQAATAAQGASGDGSNVGDTYLATISSRLENAIAARSANYNPSWLGGERTQDVGSDWTWRWVTGPEGLQDSGNGLPFFTQTTNGTGGTTLVYSNWNGGEPNGSGTGASVGEQYLQFTGTEGKWNDLSNTNTAGISGYLTETNLSASSLTINAGTGAVQFDGAVGASKELDALTVTADGGIAINGGAVTTEGVQTYNDAVTLGASSTTLTQTDADIDFTLQGGQSITNASGGDASLTIQTTDNILLGASSTISSSAGELDIILWSDSDNNSTGGIQLVNGTSSDRTTISTNGGDIIMGGGLGADGAPTGYAWTADGWRGGVDIQWFSTLDAGSGDISLRGANSVTGANYGIGVRLIGDTSISDSTLLSGHNITIDGQASDNSGVYIENWGVGIQFGSTVTGTGAINITGTGGGAGDSRNNYGVLLYNNSRVEATGSGSVSITGTATNSGSGTSNDGVRLYDSNGDGVSVSSASGLVTMTGSSSGTNASSNGIDFSHGTTGVSSTSGNIILNADDFNIASSSMATAGTVTIQPYGDDFTNALDTYIFPLSSSVTGLTIGKSTTSADGTSDAAVTIGNAISIAGPITVYGRDISVNENLTTTASGGTGVLLKASGNIVQGASVDVTTSGSDVIYWADSDAIDGGYIHIKDSSTIQTNSGSISFVGGVDGAGYAEGTSTQTIDPNHQDGISIFNSTLDSGGGTITLKSRGYAGDLTLHGGGLWTGWGTIDTGGGDLVMDVQAQENLGATEGVGGIRYGAFLNGTTISTDGGNVQISTASPSLTWCGFWSDSSINAGTGDISISDSTSGKVYIGNSITSNNLSLVNNSTMEINGALMVGGNLTLSSGAAITQTQALDVNGTTSITAGFGNNIILNNASNDFTGAVSIVSGNNVSLRDANSLILADAIVNGDYDVTAASSVSAASNIVLNGGDLIINAAQASTISGILSGTGGLQTLGSGALSISNENNTFIGQTTIASGATLSTTDAYGQSLSTTSHIQNSGALVFANANNTATIQSVAGSGDVQLASSSIEIENNSGEVSGVISGSGGISLSCGSLTLSGDNTFSGPLNISAATVVAKHNNALGATSSGTSISQGATLALENDISVAEPLSVAGEGLNDGGAIINRGTNTISGAVTLVGADVTVVSESGTLIFGNTINGAYGLTLEGSGEVSFEAILGGESPLSFLDANAGTTTYVGANITTLGEQIYRNNVSAAAGVVLKAVGIEGETVENIAAGLANTAYSISSGSSPPGEVVANAFDGNATTKYLNFSGAGTGVLIEGAQAYVVTGLKLTTANDAQERDPASFTLYGSNTSTTEGMVQIATGELSPPSDRETDYPEITFENNTAYTYYELIFDSIRGGGSDTLVQVSRIYLPGAFPLTGDDANISFTSTLAAAADFSVEAVNNIEINDALSANGKIDITSLSGNISIGGDISSDSTASDALVINAGKDSTSGTAAGGEILINSGSVSVGTDGRATLYSGSVSSSTGLTDLVGSSSGNFRYNSDETTDFSAGSWTALGSGTYAIYREQPTVTVTAEDDSKTYDGDTYTGGNGVSYSGFANGDTSMVLSGTLAYGGSSQAAVDASTYSIIPSGYSNGLGYALSYVDGSLTVLPAVLNITADNDSKTYGEAVTFTGTEFTFSGLQNSETIGSVTLASTGAAATAGVGSSPYTITVSEATGGSFSTGNYDITYTNGSLTIDKKNATVTANSDSVIYNGVAQSVTGFTATGLVNSETTSVLDGVSTSDGSGTNAGSYTHTASGTDDNYNLTFVNGALVITPAALSITADNASKTYGETVTFAGSEFTSDGLQNSETIGSVTLASTGAAATAGVGSSPYTITVSETTGGSFSAGNYDITYTNGSLTIDKKNATVTANSDSVIYNGVAQSVTGFTATGLVNSETTSVLDGVSTSDGSGTNAGSYTHTASGTDDNYNLTFVNGALVITPAALSITADNASKTYGEAVTFTGTEFTSSGLQNSETIGSVSLSSTGAAATANVAGSPYAITASDATGETFTAGNYTITYNNGSLTIIEGTPNTSPSSSENPSSPAALTNVIASIVPPLKSVNGTQEQLTERSGAKLPIGPGTGSDLFNTKELGLLIIDRTGYVSDDEVRM